MRSLVQGIARSRLGRSMLVLAALVFLWRAGYGDSSSGFGLWNARGSWDLWRQIREWTRFYGTPLTDIAEALAETAVIMAAVVALAYAVRWVMHAR